MPVVNPLARELVFKIVYYGPGLGGKTTSLQHVHKTARPEHRGRLVSLATPVDRTLYFDFLPLRLPDVRGMSVRLQLFTVPGQVYYNATRKLVLTGADGVVLVVDSQRERLDANLESLENLRENLREHGRSLEEVPFAIQYNKRDLPAPLAMEELERRLNPRGVPSFESVATRGSGVYETLDSITRAVLRELQRRIPDHGPAQSPDMLLAERGLQEVLQTASISPTPSEPPEPVEAVPATLPPEEEPSKPGSGPPRPPTLPSLRSPAPMSVPRPPDVAVVKPSAPLGFSLAPLFASAERSLAAQLETSLASGDAPGAVALADQLASRIFASAGSLVGTTGDAPRDPAIVALLLGVSGVRYLRFRGLVRRSRQQTISHEDALDAYGFVLELCRARSDVAR